jgi:hypothetical protein
MDERDRVLSSPRAPGWARVWSRVARTWEAISLQRISRLTFFVVFVAALAAVVQGLIGVLPAALAQTESESTALVEGARRAHDLGHLDEAIASYGRAYQLSGDPRLLFEMAEAQREAGRDAEALRSFKTYLRRDPAGTYRPSAEKEVRELEQQLKTPGAAAPSVSAHKPEKLEPSGESPPVAARAPAIVPVVVPPPAVVPPARTSPPTSTVPRTISAPAPVTPLTSGGASRPLAAPTAKTAPRPIVQVPPAFVPVPSNSRATPSATVVDLSRPASSTPATPAESSRSSLPGWVPWALGGATLALATGTVISGLSASSRFDELKNSCGQSGCTAAEIDDVKSRASRTNVLLALTGVAALGTGVAVYFTMDSAGATGQWRF